MKRSSLVENLFIRSSKYNVNDNIVIHASVTRRVVREKTMALNIYLILFHIMENMKHDYAS